MVKNNYTRDWGIGQWGENIPQRDEDIVKKEVGKRFPYWGNKDNFNMNRVLVGNIQRDNYFKDQSKLTTFKHIVDQIYYHVKYVTPWEPGTHSNKSAGGLCSQVRGVGTAGRPTRAFMLLAKLMTFVPTVSQVQMLLDHRDSPCIRAIGFLFLRFVCEPSELWDWFQPYFDDPEEIKMGRDDKVTITIGEMVRKVLQDITFYETYFYRIPVALHRKILSDMQELGYEVRGLEQQSAGTSNVTDASAGRKRGMQRRELAAKSSQMEKRVDPTDGNAYTKKEFLEVYGGLTEWNRARPRGAKKKRKKTADWLGGDGFESDGDGNYEEELATAEAEGQSNAAATVASDGEERRVDPSDGCSYTKLEFIMAYGRLDEWDGAGSGAGAGATPPGPPPPGPPPGAAAPPGPPPVEDVTVVAASIESAAPIERRIDSSDGRPYTQKEFLKLYGGTSEWDQAKLASSSRAQAGGTSDFKACSSTVASGTTATIKSADLLLESIDVELRQKKRKGRSSQDRSGSRDHKDRSRSRSHRRPERERDADRDNRRRNDRDRDRHGHERRSRSRRDRRDRDRDDDPEHPRRSTHRSRSRSRTRREDDRSRDYRDPEEEEKGSKVRQRDLSSRSRSRSRGRRRKYG